MIDKIKYCKCGHKLKPNHQNPGKFLKWKYNKNTNCNSCYCDRFINRVRPREEKPLAIILLGLIAIISTIFLYTGLTVYQIAIEHKEELQSKPADLTQYDMLVIGGAAMFLFAVWLFSYGLSPVWDQLYVKKRKEMPIDDSDPHE